MVINHRSFSDDISVEEDLRGILMKKAIYLGSILLFFVFLIGGCFSLDQKVVNSRAFLILSEDGSISIKALKELTGIDVIIAASLKMETITVDDSLLKIVTHSDEDTTRIAIVSTWANIVEGEEIARINGNFTTLKNR